MKGLLCYSAGIITTFLIAIGIYYGIDFIVNWHDGDYLLFAMLWILRLMVLAIVIGFGIGLGSFLKDQWDFKRSQA